MKSRRWVDAGRRLRRNAGTVRSPGTGCIPIAFERCPVQSPRASTAHGERIDSTRLLALSLCPSRRSTLWRTRTPLSALLCARPRRARKLSLNNWSPDRCVRVVSVARNEPRRVRRALTAVIKYLPGNNRPKKGTPSRRWSRHSRPSISIFFHFLFVPFFRDQRKKAFQNYFVFFNPFQFTSHFV